MENKDKDQQQSSSSLMDRIKSVDKSTALKGGLGIIGVILLFFLGKMGWGAAVKKAAAYKEKKATPTGTTDNAKASTEPTAKSSPVPDDATNPTPDSNEKPSTVNNDTAPDQTQQG